MVDNQSRGRRLNSQLLGLLGETSNQSPSPYDLYVGGMINPSLLNQL